MASSNTTNKGASLHLGQLVEHANLGLGKILKVVGRNLVVHFVDDGAEKTLSPAGMSLQHAQLLPGRHVAIYPSAHLAEVRRGRLTEKGLYEYQVRMQDGQERWLSEIELLPLRAVTQLGPLDRLRAHQIEGHRFFRSREDLLEAIALTTKNAAGLHALLSSRIDLRAHQAFVAGSVLLDPRRRYILADEVGLGKTIEAGIIIHDLLRRKPRARILIISPGALVRQWLCEMYAKFSGYVFGLVDLRSDSASYPWESQPRTIISTRLALLEEDALLQEAWDMVVVDEAHQLLSSAKLYRTVQRLSEKAPSLLLLSAIPAQRREDEYFRLLALLEPGRYGEKGSIGQEQFVALFASQEVLGRRIRILHNRLHAFAKGELTAADVVSAAKKLADAIPLPECLPPGLSPAEWELTSPNLEMVAQEFLRGVADRCRINRRILRNRRELLVEQKSIVAIERRFEPHSYEPEPVETLAWQAVADLLRSAQSLKLGKTLLFPLARALFNSLTSPKTALALLHALRTAQSKKVTSEGLEFVGTGNLLGAGDWSAFLGILAAGARNSLSDEALEQAIERVKSWNDFPKAQTRLLALFDFLDRYVDEKPKLLIFAGFPGLCEWLSEELQTRYGPVAVVEFREALPDDEKERNVERFREHNETWIMVSDESGGEGRNFQFASELIQFDTPWFAGRVEQRIGRLDRMGRERVALNVTTHVFFPEGTLEEGLVHTFNNGLGVYRRSISGLEFALRDVEQTLIERALQEDGFDALIQYAPTLNEIAEAERNRSESEVVLDEASFERNAAERYLHVSQQDGAERMLEGAFVHHLDNLASIDAHDFGAKRAWDDTFPDSIWKFFPERVKGLTIPSDMLIAKEYIQGTFRREVAQTRPHISFMSPGNLLFDLVTQRLVGTPTGRVYAIRCALPSREPWTGFEFVFRARPANPEGKQGILNRAEGCLAAKPIRVFIDPTYQIAQSEPLVLARRSLREEDRERTWFNLNGSKAEILDRFFYPRAWADVLQATFEDASAHAHARFCDLLQPGVDLELRRLKEEERQARSIESIEEAEELAQLHKSLSGWEMVLDSVGFLAINPDIGGKS